MNNFYETYIFLICCMLGSENILKKYSGSAWDQFFYL